MAHTIVEARLVGAIINVGFAIATIPSDSAETFVMVDSVHTCSTVLARLFGAIVDVDLAIDTFESFRAFTCVFGDTINALASVLAWVLGAIINIDFAILSSISFRTDTGVIVDAIKALSAVLARSSCLQASSFSSTSPGEGVGRGFWCRSDQFRQFSNDAFVDVDFAVGSGESRSAIAGVLVDTILASSSVLAWLRSTLVDVNFTVVSPVSR